MRGEVYNPLAQRALSLATLGRLLLFTEMPLRPSRKPRRLRTQKEPSQLRPDPLHIHVQTPEILELAEFFENPTHLFPVISSQRGDRKSTRLNSSHANISYAVFCLKK